MRKVSVDMACLISMVDPNKLGSLGQVLPTPKSQSI